MSGERGGSKEASGVQHPDTIGIKWRERLPNSRLEHWDRDTEEQAYGNVESTQSVLVQPVTRSRGRNFACAT